MNFVLPFCLFGISTSIILGIIFLLKGKGKFISNMFLGVFFLLLAIRLGKLLAQEYAPTIILDTYFNLMHAAFLAIGPVIWLYICTYLSPISFRRNNVFTHFIPTLISLLFAFHIRKISGEPAWFFIYWIIQIHPLLYVFRSVKLLIQSPYSKKLTPNQRIWLYSLLGIVAFIVGMNILYFIFNFPFYLVTALLLIVTFYIFTFLSFNNKINVLVGKSDKKYKNLNILPQQINQLQEKINWLLLDQEWYLNDQIKLSDISDKLSTPTHIISRVINESSGMSFPEYLNHLRIERAQKKIIAEEGKKIIAIALESGFCSLSAFNRAFKKNSGMSPSKYRTRYSTKTVTDLESR